jgi:peptidoglycan hydrolase-like protein with peptidoglycan-binding domain
MKKFVFIILALGVAVYLIGCGKKKQPIEEVQQPMTMEELSKLGTETKLTPAAQPQTQLEPLPPAGPYKPTNEQIQTALKNAGFYTGAIDGKVGPLTKRAVEEFQKANGLSVDGKVGPKTWAVLSKYLNPSATETTPATQ